MGLDPLFIVSNILLCVVLLDENIFGPLGYTLDYPQLRCVILFHVCPSFLLLAGRPAIDVGDAFKVYLLWTGDVAVLFGMMGGGGGLLVAWGR